MAVNNSNDNKIEIVVEANNVWESFRIYHHRNLTIKDTLIRLRRSIYEEFWALKDISFKVKKGETLGIIGENGSGKSTLLKCIAGILKPTKGDINVTGRISPLLELGAGFHPELSGRENTFINGAILGLSKKQIEERYDDIVAFSELEDFIDTQVKYYSSGMYIRLGFSVAVFSDPDILLIDEILAVGDESFKKKSFDKMKEFKKLGKTIILVTHDMGTAAQFCDRLILLKNGSLREKGKPRKVVRKYVDTSLEEEQLKEKGNREIILKNFDLLNSDGKKCDRLSPGDSLIIKADYSTRKKIRNPVFGFSIHDQQGNHCFGTNTRLKKVKTGLVSGEGTITYEIQNLPMLDGKYYISLAVISTNERIQYHWLDNILQFEVQNPTDDVGVYHVPVECRIEKNKLPVLDGGKVGKNV